MGLIVSMAIVALLIESSEGSLDALSGVKGGYRVKQRFLAHTLKLVKQGQKDREQAATYELIP